jgi:GntR family transcriptional regulator
MQQSRPRDKRFSGNRAARQLRDQIRSNITHCVYPGGHLPGETELMVAHRASRGTVRDALAMLREEGVVNRVQGIGTFVVAEPIQARLIEAHGLSRPEDLAASALFGHCWPRVLQRTVGPTPEAVVRRLDAEPGSECLTLEYVAFIGDNPIAFVTNYVLFPEANALLETEFNNDWYRYMLDANLVVGDSEFWISCLSVDPSVANHLEVAPGSPVMLMEQVILNPEDRKFNFAVIYSRADGMTFYSRASWQRDR